jgi:Kef-type K+ transport system membrane component KefB/mannitol/fructose-specific phosphotransferase system IIA component (Ntr-type)
MENSQVFLLLSLGVLLVTARVLGELSKHIGFPTVLGEILAGVLLGPTCLGALSPDVWHALFPATGVNADVLTGLVSVSIVLFLLSSGMEVDLSSVIRQGRTAFFISSTGIIIPFVIGLLSAFLFPTFLGMGEHGNRIVFSLFLGTALSISALPVIAKTLLDLKLYRTDLGMIVMPAAIIDDVIGWSVFAVILSFVGVHPKFSLPITIVLTVTFGVLMLTLARKIFDRLLPWIQAHWTWPGGIIGLGVAFALICASFTEWIGIHALFGAFFCGIALGDSRHMNEKTRFAFDSFISNFFAPLFFGSIGLKLNVVAHFDLPLVLVVIAIASIGKFLGALIGGRFAGLSRRDSMAVGAAMNARGAMEIILGIVALKYELISPKTFVALVIMALVTSLMSGPAIKRILNLERAHSFIRYLKVRNPFRFKNGVTRDEAIALLVSEIGIACKGSINAALATRAVLDREATMHTGLGHGLAVPHARIEGIRKPMIAVGISEEGIDFDAPDGLAANVVVLLLAPASSNTLLLQIYADIAKTFAHESAVQRIVEAKTSTEFIAALKMSKHEGR